MMEKALYKQNVPLETVNQNLASIIHEIQKCKIQSFPGMTWLSGKRAM